MKNHTSSKTIIKWPEIWSLAALNASIVICWIAYHEYQPKLLAGFGLTDLAILLLYGKAIILVVIPPLAGFLSDKLIFKNNKIYLVFLVGIIGTAMIFMIVASIIFQGHDSPLTPILPVMVILWLVGMNVFHTPANSLVQMFAPSKQLPIAMGILVLVSELIYALEPLVVALVDFFGATLTFVVGGVLISVSGLIFKKVSSEEVLVKKQDQMRETTHETKSSNFIKVVGIGLLLGLGHSLIMGYIPDQFGRLIAANLHGNYFASMLLGAAALLALPISRFSARAKLTKSLSLAMIILAVSIFFIFIPTAFTFITGSILLAIFFSLISVTALPFALQNLSVRHVTFGVGLFFGATELFDGIVEILKGV